VKGDAILPAVPNIQIHPAFQFHLSDPEFKKQAKLIIKRNNKKKR